jgi:anthranilate synthase component I
MTVETFERISHQFAADLETPVSAFLKLTPLQPIFLLESVERNEAVGRFSFLGILPKEYLIWNQDEEARTFFEQVIANVSKLPADQNSPLSSGLIGFISYHAAARLHPKLPLKSTRFPLAGFVLPGAILTFDHVKRRITLSSCLPTDEEARLANEIKTCLRSTVRLPKPGKSTLPISGTSDREFCNQVSRILKHIHDGDIFQAVLSMQFEGSSDADPFQMYRALRMINPSPYMFYLNFQDRFQFFGSSPETMVRTENRDDRSLRVIVRPIAGTRPRGNNPAEEQALQKDLLSDKKERAEHLMLLDLARNDVGRIAASGTVSVSEFMKVERYSHVMHLVSTVEGHASNNLSPQKLFEAVFPAGTVSGAPKIRAMQIIDELEPHERGLYGGSLGYFGSSGQMDHCLSIRCLLREQDRYLYTAGAGIVADSVPEKEHQEILNKAMALSTMLKMVEENL